METQNLKSAIELLEAERAAQLKLLGDVSAKIDRAHNEYMMIKERLEDIDQAIETVESLLDKNDEPPETTAEFVRYALRTAGHALQDRDILALIQNAGWTTKSDDRLNLLRSFLSRMIKESEVVRVEEATYDLPERVEVSSKNGRADQDSHAVAESG